MTCSQVWERLASNDEGHISTLPKPTSPTATAPGSETTTIGPSRLPTHISFSYDSSQEDNEVHVEQGEDESDDTESMVNDKDDFQYVPLSSQSKLVQLQFLSFARQQQFLLENEHSKKDEHDYDHSMDEDEDDEDVDDHDDNLNDEVTEGDQEVNSRSSSMVLPNSLTALPFRISVRRNANVQFHRRNLSMKRQLYLPRMVIKPVHQQQRRNPLEPRSRNSKIRMPISNV